MDRWVHGIGADGAFKKFMYAGGRRDRRRHCVADDAATVGVRRLRDLMVMRLLVVDPIGRGHTFDAIQFHSYNNEKPPLQIPSPTSLNSNPTSLPLLSLSLPSSKIPKRERKDGKRRRESKIRSK
ncbi:hypothetical protein ACLOJK_010257 [Asimina triloba]